MPPSSSQVANRGTAAYISLLDVLTLARVLLVGGEVRDGLRGRGAADGEQQEYGASAVVEGLPDTVRRLPLQQ